MSVPTPTSPARVAARPASDASPPPGSPELLDLDQLRRDMLDELDGSFDPDADLIRQPMAARPSHSRVPDGEMVHFVLPSLDYALLLLRLRPGRDAERRARGVLRRVIAMQGNDPTTVAFGLWPWIAEEPLHAMVRMDGNWSEFVGGRLAQLARRHGDRLGDEACAQCLDALGDAAMAIFRRNVGPFYTNIAIMGAGATAAAGELLGDGRLLRYGRRRFERVVEHHRFHGEFNEYQSPAYLPITLWELHRAAMLIDDPPTRERIETLRRDCWQTIVRQLHVDTGQLAGPWSRTYGDFVRPAFAEFLKRATGLDLTPHPSIHGDNAGALLATVEHPPCPFDLLEQLRHRPRRREVKTSFIRRPEPRHCVHGTTYFDHHACLGSVNQGSMWNQRRNVLAFWACRDAPAATARVRLLIDGQDCASFFLRSDQRGPTVLCGLELHNDHGFEHLIFDHPTDGVFSFSDCRLSIELRAEHAACGRPWASSDVHRLEADGTSIDVYPAASSTGLGPVQWELRRDTGFAAVDAVLYRGAIRDVPLSGFAPLAVAFGLHLGALPAQPLDQAPLMVVDDSERRDAIDHHAASWTPRSGTHLSVVTAAEPVATGFHPMGEPGLPVPEPVYRGCP